MLEFGISYPGKFWIDTDSLKELYFYGNAKIKEDNSFYIETELPRSHYLVYNYLINDSVFKVYGEVNGKKISVPRMWGNKITAMHATLKSNCIYTGDVFIDSNEKIKKVSANFSGFKALLDNEIQGKEFTLNEDKISYSQEYSDRKDKATTLIIDFKVPKGLDEVIDLLDTINSFFVLINNVPSEIKNILVLTESDVQYEINESWLPVETLNQIQPSRTGKLGLNNLNEYLEKWIVFSKGCQIACEQYFALVTLNKKYYSQLTLSLAIFAFEGFLNRCIELEASQQRNNKCDRYISRAQHKDFCDKILFPELERLIKEKFGNKTQYLETMKNCLNYAYETTFENRITSFFERNNAFFNDSFAELNETRESFIKKILCFRNTYAHDSDSKIEEVKSIENTFEFYKVINKAIRILILKDFLQLDDISFQK